MTIRQLRPQEPIPSSLITGFEGMPLDNEWIWVAEECGQIKGVMITMGAHGILFLLRVVALPGVSSLWFRSMYRVALKAGKERGYDMYVVYLDGNRKHERQLADIIVKNGGSVLPVSGFAICGGMIDAVINREHKHAA